MSRAPRVDLDRIAERCASLGLTHAAERLGELLEEAAEPEYAEWLHLLGRGDLLVQK